MCGDARRARELADRAADLVDEAGKVGDCHDRHWTGFGSTAVELARMVAAVELGVGGEAVLRHERIVSSDGWRALPTEHRAAYLLDAARAYLQVGNPRAAGRTLVDAERTAPAEVRLRPVARTLIADLVRGGPLPADVARLATALGQG